MALYVDSSALLKRYVDEHDSEAAVAAMASDAVLVTSRLAEVEVRRNLARLLDEQQVAAARLQLSVDLDALRWLLSMPRPVAMLRSSPSRRCVVHLMRCIWPQPAVAGARTALLTFDLRQAQVGRAPRDDGARSVTTRSAVGQNR